MRPDPIELEVFKHLFHSIAEEMGAALRRTAFSPNIKERRDYSCALFDAAGNALAMGDHMPVHLGSMPMSVRAAIADLRLAPGDVAMLNDPFRGGTHLPDITVVAPVFVGRAEHKAARPRHNAAPECFVAARAHHADVGGTYAGSMGPCREIYQEGFRIPPVKIVRAGTLDRDILALLLNNVRTPQEREGDLSAQLAACHIGSTRLIELCARYSLPRVQRAARALLDYSEKMMRAFLATVPPGSYAAEDVLDDDGVRDEPVRIAVRITFPRAPKSHAKKTHASKKPRPVLVDFTGSAPQVEGSINAVEAITYSACFYVFRCLLREDVPATAGLMRPIQLIAPEGTVVNARPPAAVAGGNVETSQRIVDTLLRALAQALPTQIPAASSGTMNNLTIGGMDDRHSTFRHGASNSSSVILSDESGRPGDRTRSRRTSILPTHLARASMERSVKGVEDPAVLARASSSAMNNLTIGSMDDRPPARSASLRHVSTMALEAARLQRPHKKSASESSASANEHSVSASEPSASARERLVSASKNSASARDRLVSASKNSASASEPSVSASEQPVSTSKSSVSGHDFSRADKTFFACYPEEGFSPTRDLQFRLRNPAPRSSHPESTSSSVILSDESGRRGDRTRSRRTPTSPTQLPSAASGPTPFAYYETIAGGSGASATHDGVSGVHTHMTNSLNTPAEALEYSYPLRVTKYALRRGSQAVSSKGDAELKSSPQGDTSVAHGVRDSVSIHFSSPPVDWNEQKSNPVGVEAHLAQDGAQRSPGYGGKKGSSPVGTAGYSHRLVSPGSAGLGVSESLQGRHASGSSRAAQYRLEGPSSREGLPSALSSRGRLQPDEGSAFPDNRQPTTDNFPPGAGKHRGGDGIIREIEVLTDVTVTLLSDRRKFRPYGLAGGEPGAPGRTVIFRLDGSTELMPSKGSTRLQRGERIRIETPGGGGWGPPSQDGEDSSD